MTCGWRCGCALRYERAAVLQWYRRHKVSPATGYPVKTRAVRPCNTLRKEIKAWLHQHPDVNARLPEMARAQYVACVVELAGVAPPTTAAVAPRYLAFAVRVQQDLVFSLLPRGDDEVKARGFSELFGMSEEVRMILIKTSMTQYAKVSTHHIARTRGTLARYALM